MLEPGAGGAHEDHHVLRPAGAEFPGILVCDGIALPQQIVDPFGHKPGLQQRAGDLLLLPVLGREKQVELCLAVLPGGQVGRAEVQPLRLAVVHLPHLPAHEVGEDKVGRIQYRRTGPEILTEQDPPGLPLGGVGGVRIDPVLL